MSAPKIPPYPKPPPAPPQQIDPTVQEARRRRRAMAAQLFARNSGILTGPYGTSGGGVQQRTSTLGGIPTTLGSP